MFLTAPARFAGIVFKGHLERELQAVNRSQFNVDGVVPGHIARRKEPHTAVAVSCFQRIKPADEIEVAARGSEGAAEVTGGNFHQVVTEPKIGHGVEKLLAFFIIKGAGIRLEFVFEGKTNLPAVAEFFFTGQAEDGVTGPGAFHAEAVRGRFATDSLRVCVNETRGHRTVEFHVGSHRRTRKGAENGNRSKRFFI